MSHAGRPEVYSTHIAPNLENITKWYKTMSVRQIATKLGISKTTLYEYAKTFPELQAALDAGKEQFTEDLKSAIKKRALGYTYTETTTKETKEYIDGMACTTEIVTTKTKKHVPPDLGSAHLLLKNLDPDWHDADKTTIKHRERELEIKEKRADAENWIATVSVNAE